MTMTVAAYMSQIWPILTYNCSYFFGAWAKFLSSNSPKVTGEGFKFRPQQAGDAAAIPVDMSPTPVLPDG